MHRPYTAPREDRLPTTSRLSRPAALRSSWNDLSSCPRASPLECRSGASVHCEPMTPTTVPLARASTIPKRYYLDPDILAAEKELIFGRTWQLVARTDELQRVGDFVPVTVLDEPIVVTHGIDGELRAFYNVCRHRAGQVALSRGNRKSLQCRYHGWTYGLD